jgi:Protein of unknown function (DUF3485)
MNPRANKFLTIALAAAVVLALLWDLVPLRDAQARVNQLPANGLGFTGMNVPLNDTEKSIYGAAQVVKRIYRVGRRNFAVVIIDGARNRHAVHDPTYCFRGAGWEISGERELPVAGGAAKIVTLQKGAETRTASFWFSDGQTRHGSVTRCWWQMACRRMTFGASGAQPVLALVQPLDGGDVNWEMLPAQLPFLFDF